MVRRSAPRAAALGLALRLLLGLGLGMEAAPTSGTTQSPAQASSPSTGFCPPTRFQCRTSGFCVPLSWRCDGDQDCPDGSDEECKVEPCAQDGQCPPPTGSPCSCDNIHDCPDGIKKNLPNCSSEPCQKGEFRCPLDGTCVPHTWLCDGHPDCPDSSDELGCGTETLQEVMSLETSVTQESVTYLRNATTTLIRDQDSVHSGNQNADGVITAAVVLSASLVAATLLVLFWLCARGLLCTLGLPVAVKESLAALRTSSCHHIAQARSVEAMGTGTLLLAQQPSDVDSCGHAALQT